MKIRLNSWKVALPVFILVAVIFFSPFLKNIQNQGSHYDWDLYSFYEGAPRKTILEYHQFPLWNPYYCGGNVLLATPETRFLSPAFLLVLFFGAVAGLKLEIVLHVIIGMFGMWLLARHFKLGKISSYLPPFIFMLNSAFILHISAAHIEWTSIAFAPFVFLFYLKAIDSDKSPFKLLKGINLKYVLAAGIFLALMILSGATYPLPFTALFLGIYTILKTLKLKSSKPVIVLCLLLMTAVMLGAVKVLPTAGLLYENPRSDSPKVYYRPSLLLEGLLSKDQALESKHFTQQDFATAGNLGQDTLPWWEYGMYIGLVPLLLIALSLFFDFKEKKNLLLITLIFILLVLGESFVLWKILSKFPIYSSLRNPVRFSVFLMMLFGLLAGASLSKLEKMGKLAKLVVVIVIVYVLFNLYVVNHLIAEDLFEREPVQIDPQPEFYHVMPQGSRHFTDQYSNMVNNMGTLRCYEAIPIATIKNRDLWGYVHTGAAIPKGAPGYMGEVFLASAQGTVEIEKFSPNKVIAGVNATGDDFLVLNQNYHYGWKSSAGKVEQYEGLVSVAVSQGTEKVKFYYLPSLFVAGMIITILSIIGFVYIWRKS